MMAQQGSIEAMWQFIRYGMLGVVSNVLAYLAYLLVTHNGIDPKLAMSLLYVIVFMVSYFGNRHWTFSHSGSLSASAIRFFAAHVGGYSINLCALYVFVDRYGYNHQIVQLLVMLFLVFYFFVALKFFVFNDAHLQGE